MHLVWAYVPLLKLMRGKINQETWSSIDCFTVQRFSYVDKMYFPAKSLLQESISHQSNAKMHLSLYVLKWFSACTPAERPFICRIPREDQVMKSLDEQTRKGTDGKTCEKLSNFLDDWSNSHPWIRFCWPTLQRAMLLTFTWLSGR